MKKQNLFSAYVLIGIGIYFLMKQFNVPFLTKFHGWPTILIIIGLALLLHSYRSKDYHNLFSGIVVLGIGVHFHGLHNYSFWPNHWAVYLLIVGIAFLVRSLWTKQDLAIGFISTAIASMFIFSETIPDWFKSPLKFLNYIDKLWPIAIIILGIYLLKKK